MNRRKRRERSPLNYVQGAALVAARDGQANNLTGTRKASVTAMVRKGWVTADRTALTAQGIMALANLQAWEARHGHPITGEDV